MAFKNIVVLSDGTGNSAAALSKTNVWRTYRALDLASEAPPASPRQVAMYSDGVGTSSFRPVALLGGIFGVGLSRNVIELYKFVCRTYEPGDQIYAFGFSRGAFTIRVLVALLADQGVVRVGTEEELDVRARDAYRSYRRRFKLPLWGSKHDYSDSERDETIGIVDRVRNARDAVLNTWRKARSPDYKKYSRDDNWQIKKIRFVGVWDTVAAYGLPIDELTRGIDEWVWPLSMPNYELSGKVETARHALALDEERDSFRPLLWDERREDELAKAEPSMKERLKQVWFAGVHSNVGGGYADDTLSYVPLTWMVEEAKAAGLRFNEQALCESYPPPNPLGRIYDSRAGIGSYYRYQPRRLSAWLLKPKQGTQLMRDPRLSDRGFLREALVHDSVVQRMEKGQDRYAPMSLPASFQVVATLGSTSGSIPQTVSSDSRLRQWLWNDVWRRRICFFATVLLSSLLVALPLIHGIDPPSACEGPQCLLSGPISAVGGVLPNFVSPWIEAFARTPGTFLLIATGIWLLFQQSRTLRQRIRDDARALWLLAPGEGQDDSPAMRRTRGGIENTIRDLRTSETYQRAFQWLKWTLAPLFFGVLLLLTLTIAGVAGLYLVVMRTALVVAERTDSICDLAKVDPSTERRPGEFTTDMTCWKTESVVQEGRRYRLTITVTSPWFDDTIATNPAGFGNERMPWAIRPFVLVRRSLNDRWMQPILRVRQPDGDLHLKALEMRCAAGCDSDRPVFTTEFDAPVSGKVGLFLNDAAIGWGLTSSFYDNNRGGATLSLSELRPGIGASAPVKLDP